MGICLTDAVIESVLRNGLKAIRDNPLRLDDLFSTMLEDHLSSHYGADAIAGIKDFILNNRISIVFGWNQIPSVLPCISISLLSADEIPELAVMNDFSQTIEANDVADIILSITPTSYNSSTGAITFNNSVDLSNITTSVLFKDHSNVEFEILGIINEPTNKVIFIDIAKIVDISGTCSAVSNLNFSRDSYNMIPINERILIGCHTDSAALTKHLFYIVVYIINARRATIVSRGIELSHFSGSDFSREMNFLPSNVLSRFITLQGITRFYYKEEEQDLASDIGQTVNVEREADQFPRTDETDFNVRTILKTED